MELFKLLGTIAIENGEANNAIDETTGKAERVQGKLGKALGKIGSAAVKVGAVAGAGIAAVATGIGALTKQAIGEYSNYEQLVGGVETLFKDSSDKVVKYANDAYKTAGLSANEYMDTVTSFSASLLQGLGGDTDKAAEIANQAIVDMSDNANKMGTDMASIQNAYQGFAKQNYTMLDNLKLGYGGTASEMARLINDSGVLGDTVEVTADTVNDVSFDKIIEAIHVIQDNMGITGTTAKEASTTIQGSIGMMQSAWTNFLTGMADPDQDFDALLGNLVDSVVTVADNLIPRITATLPRVVQGISKLIQSLAPHVPEILNDLVPAIVSGAIELVNQVVDALPQLLQILLDALPQLIEGLVEIFNGIINALPQLIEMLIAALPALLPLLIKGCAQLDAGIAGSLSQILMALVAAMPQIVMELAAEFAKAFPNFTKAIGDLFGSVGDVVKNAWNTVTNAVQVGIMFIAELIHAGNELITLPFRFIWENCKEYILPVWDEIKNAVSNAIDNIKTVIVNIWNDISEPISNAFNKLKEIVGNKFDSIKTSISNGIDAAKNAVFNTLGKIKDKFGEIFENAKNIVGNAIEKIKSFFHFEWSLPNLKMPHPKMEGKFSLNPPEVPHFSIDWYKKAMDDPMIMDQPTAFGINRSGQIMAGGEAGSEVVSGTDTLMGMIKGAVSSNGISKEDLYSTIVEALVYVMKNYGLNLLLGIDADTNAMFKNVILKNNEFKKMHGGQSAFA